MSCTTTLFAAIFCLNELNLDHAFLFSAIATEKEVGVCFRKGKGSQTAHPIGGQRSFCLLTLDQSPGCAITGAAINLLTIARQAWLRIIRFPSEVEAQQEACCGACGAEALRLFQGTTNEEIP